MANDQRQGTGRHGHKDSKEPWPHTQGNRGQQSQSESRNRNQQQQGGSDQRRQQQQDSGGRSDRGEQQSLKSREYKGDDGQIHHHTRTYMEQHGKDGDRRDR